MTAAALAPIALKGALVLAVAFAAIRLLRGAPAALRHSVWTATFAALLVVPLLDAVGPSWALPILPERAGSRTETVEAVVVAGPFAGPLPDGALVLSPDELPPGEPVLAPEPFAWAEPGEAVVLVPGPPRPEATPSLPARPRAPFWGFVLAVLWAAGAAAVLVRWAAAYVAAAFVVRGAVPVTDDDWLVLAERARRLVGVPGDVRLMQSDALTVPVAWDLGAPTVVLTADADGWSEGRREAVLLHEMAHLRRRDPRTQLVAQAAVALHWPNPLAWVAYRRFLTDREHACDDAVLAGGAAPSDYAGHLVEIARRAGRREALALAAVSPMARRSDLEGRVLAVLDAGRRRLAAGRSPLLRTVALGLLVAAPLGTVRAVASAPARVRTVGERVAPAAPTLPDVPRAPDVPSRTAPAAGAALEAALRDTIPRAEAVLGPALDAALADLRELRAARPSLGDEAWDEIEASVREAFEEARGEYDAVVAEALAEAGRPDGAALSQPAEALRSAELHVARVAAEADRQAALADRAEAAAERAAAGGRDDAARREAEARARAAQQGSREAEQAWRDRERALQEALDQSQRARDRARRDADRLRGNALRQAERDREEALRRAADARREAQRAQSRRDGTSARAPTGQPAAPSGYAYRVSEDGRVTAVATSPGVGDWMRRLGAVDQAAVHLREALAAVDSGGRPDASVVAGLRGGLAGLEEELGRVAEGAASWARSDAERQIARTRLAVTQRSVRAVRARLDALG